MKMAKYLYCALLSFVVLCSNLSTAEICMSSVCEFTLDIRWARTMTYRPADKNNAYNLDMDGDRLRIVNSTYFQDWDDAIGRYVDDITSDVITADGVRRNIIVINGQFPGPTLEVTEGSQVVVHVINELLTDGVTIHWHGMSQLYTPWMDGAAYVTQCSIEPRQSFTYRFLADPSGTHWYHSHLQNQRLDGLYGAFIIHKSVSDIPDIPVIVTDWFHEEATTLEINNPYSLNRQDKGNGDMHGFLHNRQYSVDGHELSAVLYKSGLINGRGRYDTRKLPLTTFHAQSGQRYRFRFINAAAEFSFEISIDNHVLWVVATDGADIQPLEVTSAVIHAGETIDIEVEANQPTEQYWMRARSLSAGTAAPHTQYGDRPIPQGGEVEEVKAIFRYEGSSISGDPQTNYHTCSSTSNCKIFNCPFQSYPAGSYKECIPISRASSLQTDVARNKIEYGLDDFNIQEHFFNHAFSWGSSINGNKFVYPTEPFSQKKTVPSEMSCDKESCASPDVGCVCTNIMDIPFNKTMQFVLTNFEPEMGGVFAYVGPHTIHLHGHKFAVLKMGFAEYNNSNALFTDHNPDIVCPNRLCKNPRWNGQPLNDLNLENPPIKDTVILPARGYVVIRFRSTNPGYWPMHCHAASHQVEGMNMIFREAYDRIGPVPEHFPRCKYFTWSSEQFTEYLTELKNLVKSGPLNDDYNAEKNVDDDETGKPCLQQKDNHITVDVTVAVGFTAGCIAVGALLVLLPLCIYMGCSRLRSTMNGGNH